MIRKLFIFYLLLLYGGLAEAQNKSVLLMNGTAHLGNGTVIENSVIGIKDGMIVLVADAQTIRLKSLAFDTIIQIAGRQVYPGLIAPNSTLGLTEIEAVRAMNDFAEVGFIIPNVRTLIAYNTDSKLIPTLRFNGVLIAQATPRYGMLSGTSSIFELDGWNWEDALLKADDGVHLNFPEFPVERAPGDTSLHERKINYDKQKLELKKFFLDAKAYNEEEKHEEKNIRFEAMRGVFDGTKKLFIHVDYAKDINLAVNFIQEQAVKNPVLVGAEDAWRLTSLLKENNIPLMLGRVHSLPLRADEDIDMPFRLPSVLQKAGILFCLQNEGDMATMNARNLPFLAGSAAAYGLTKEEALQAITLNAAKILGIDKKVGSLEEGKEATLFVSSGDALDMKTNNMEWVFIRGKKIDRDNEQRALYMKYKSKYKLN